MASRVNGLREEFLDVLGVLFYRCRRCESRYAKLGSRIYPIENNTEDRTHVWVLTAVGVGLLTCLGIALYIQRLAHRWPF